MGIVFGMLQGLRVSLVCMRLDEKIKVMPGTSETDEVLAMSPIVQDCRWYKVTEKYRMGM